MSCMPLATRVHFCAKNTQKMWLPRGLVHPNGITEFIYFLSFFFFFPSFYLDRLGSKTRQRETNKHALQTHTNTKLWLFIICTLYQRKVGVDMLNAVKSVLADVSSKEQRARWRANAQDVSISTSMLHGWYIVRFTATPRQTKTLFLTRTSFPLYS